MGNDPEREKLNDLTARIQQAEGKPDIEKTGTTTVSMSASRIGFDFMGSVLVCAFLGWLADKYLGSKPWGLLVMIVMGFAVGIMNVWRALSSSKPE